VNGEFLKYLWGESEWGRGILLRPGSPWSPRPPGALAYLGSALLFAVWTSARCSASIWVPYHPGDPIMKKLSMLGIVGGAALLAAVPVSLQWSQESAVPLLTVPHANAQYYYGPYRRHARRAYRRAYYGYPYSYGGYYPYSYGYYPYSY